MNKTGTKISRRQQILAALVKMLEENPGERITTASLAKIVGFSEAALYRHFPSKSKMFEGLIESIEETIFSRIAVILADEKSTSKRCEKIAFLLLNFAERNPGLSRLLVGDALTGETERLRQQIVKFFDRVETQLKNVLSDVVFSEALRINSGEVVKAHLLMTYIDGCITQYVRSEFQRVPTLHWAAEWKILEPQFL